jgi:predicted membrane protein DUF2339
MGDFSMFFVLMFLGLGVYSYVLERRRRRDKEELTEEMSSLTKRLFSLEEQVKRAGATPAATPAQVAQAPSAIQVTPRPAPAAREPVAPEKRAVETPLPPPPPPPIVRVLPQQSSPIQPTTPPVAPAASQPAPAPTPSAPSSQPMAPPAAASAEQRAPQPPTMAAPPAPMRPPAASPAPTLRTVEPPKKKSIAWEELLGTNVIPKIAVVAVVVGLGFMLASKWSDFPRWAQVLMLYAGGGALLGLGIFLERKEPFKILGRVLVGGGWAILFLLTYGIGHAPSILILHSATWDLFLMMTVAVAMVWHTLKYKSQLVTGCAFLLGFISVVASVSSGQPDPSHLIAGAILVAGLMFIVHRYQWYELEFFGILTSYGSHLYWLYRFLGFPPERIAFPHRTASVALVIGYWVVFTASYVGRKIASRGQEAISTASALLNPLLFLLVMKYQSLHPEWAWWALLTIGAVEFTLGQLPVSRHRDAPFKVLSSLGAALMVAALPFKYSGDSLEMLWLAGAEAFLLAGIFTRERLFRGFGVIISFLIAIYVMPVRIAPWIIQLLDGQPHYQAQLAVALGTIAAVLYANAHVVARRWDDLFEDEPERLSLRVLSFVASGLAVCAVFASVRDNVAATVLALMVLALSWLGRQFSIPELIFQAHWIAAVAFAQVIIIGEPLTTKWLGLPQRVWMFSAVAGLLYLSSRFVHASETVGARVFSSIYTWGATLLLSVLIYFQAPAWAVIVLWIALGLALCAAAEFFDRHDLKWQAFVLVLAASLRAALVNFDLTTTAPSLHLTYRLISVSLAATGIYLLARWSPIKALRPAYTAIATLLLTWLAFEETHSPWTPVAWISLAALLALAARWWKDRPLLWQTHFLGLLATGWTLWGSFTPHYRATSVQLFSVLITGALLYLLTWITNVDGVIGHERISHAYSWAGSLLMSWLVWSQLKEVDVALAWCVFGLLLFELPGLLERIDVRSWGSAGSWRAQSYVAMSSSFVRIFFANLNLPVAGGFVTTLLDARVLTAAPLALVYFWTYSRLNEINQSSQPNRVSAGKISRLVEYLLACVGTATITAIIWFAATTDAVATGLAALVLILLAVAWQLRHQVFLHQALIMLGLTAFRLATRNFFLLKDPVYSSLTYSIFALALVLAGLPFAFLIRRNLEAGKEARKGGWWTALVGRPEQPVFFVTLALTAVLLYLKMSGGMVTLAWAAEGVLAFILALGVKERSFRLAGLALIMFCVVKIPWDTWQFNDSRRYLSWIGVGLILFVVSFLYGKNKEALQEYL